MEILSSLSGRQKTVSANHVLFFFLFILLSFVSQGQATSGLVLTNASPSALIDFTANTPSSAGTHPQTAFTSAGFSPDPTSAGRLNSNAWALTGWSDGALVFGGTSTTSDYARGATSSTVTTGGMYAYTGAPGSAANPTLMFQPGASDFAPGSITLKVQNKGTTNISRLSVSYNLYVRNDQGRSSSFNFSHSSDDVTYSAISALNYTSPVAADVTPVWALIGTAPSRSTSISGLNIPPNGVYYLRWSTGDVGGTGSRDELGLDDINITATYVNSLPNLSIDNVSLAEGASNTQTFSFTVSLSSPAPAGGVTFDIATADNTATTAGNDYVAKSLTGQTIPAGSSTYTFDVSVNGDFNIEPDETFLVNVTNVTGATVLDGQGQGTITNDDVLITYYPKLTATDLTLLSDWTTDPAGGAGSAPPNFTWPNQLFNLNGNVDQKFNSPWVIAGGSNVVITAGSLKIGPSAVLQVGAGSTFDFNGRPVIVSSFPTNTGSIGVTLGAIANATNVTVERHISSAGNRGYRLLAPSVNTSGTIHSNWQENSSASGGVGTHITGSTTGANGFDLTQTGQPSLFTLDPVTFEYVPVANTNATNLDARKGYLLYVRGDRTIDLASTASPLPTTNTVLRATGTLLTGEQSFANLAGNEEFSLVTNPYASAIDWKNVHAASTSLKQFYTFWDPNVNQPTGGYVTIGADGSSSHPFASGANTHIQSGQAFFVQSSAGSATATVKILETHKSTTTNRDVFRTGNHSEIFSSGLFYKDQSNNRINADAVSCYYNNNYSVAVDDNDASQIPNWNEDIAISRSNYSLSIETRPLIDARDTISLVLSGLKVQAYEWEFNAAHFNHPNLTATLVDNFLNTRKAISLNGTTIIPFTVTSDPASAAAGRFLVVFGPNAALPVNLSSIKAYQKGQDIQIEWTAQAEMNMEQYEVEKSATGQLFSKIGSTAVKGGAGANDYSWLDVNAGSINYYRIKGIGKNGDIRYSRIVKVNMGKRSNEVSIFPNPVKDNVLNLSFTLPKGKYILKLINALGLEVMQKLVIHHGGSGAQSLRLEPQLATGIYQLEIADGENRYVQTIVKQ
ncbi:MAG TPA: Calx-beta domain-containing protein [Flavisolibacter sp.]|nr:Calx-beta domain-containing protein [Flavisolibacter sp.]